MRGGPSSAALEASARNRLELLGIDSDQLEEMLAAGKAETHLRIRSPISGHIIQKYVREGQYVEEGEPLYELADISTVWVEAQIYEDDIAALPLMELHKKQDGPIDINVTVTARAFPGHDFRGTVTFIYPHVDQNTRTMTVRTEVENSGRYELVPGITATVNLQIEPRAIPVLQDAVAGDSEAMALLEQNKMLAVPEFSVIETGSQTIVYREATPGVYDGTLVELGPRMNGPDNVSFFPVLSGLAAGDRVVTSGSFLVDAETRLNPAAGSIYYGGGGSGQGENSSVTTVRPSTPEDKQTKIAAALAELAPADRQRAEAQQYCAVLHDSLLGSMGVPVKVTIDGQDLFVCCGGCVAKAKEHPTETVERVQELLKKDKGASPDAAEGKSHAKPPAEEEDPIRASLAKLAPQDQALAESQHECPISEGSELGSMGVPIKLMVDGHTVFVCCEGCREQALAHPDKTLQKVRQLHRVHHEERHDD